MAHPLNRPRFDARVGRVVEGYGDPSAARHAHDARRSRHGRSSSGSSSGPAGIDPYATAVSDVYQDLFGEGSYTGKGIYDVDAFEAALAGRVPENALLSHDLFEGSSRGPDWSPTSSCSRSSRRDYEVAAVRQHRWARGDWQLLPWIIRGRRQSRSPAQRASRSIGRWKMLDNLRRTLSAPAAFLTLVAGWTLPQPPAARVDDVRPRHDRAARPLSRRLPSVIRDAPGISKRSHCAPSAGARRWPPSQIALCDHVPRAPGVADGRRDRPHARPRCSVTHRRLLEWMTAAQAKSDLSLDLPAPIGGCVGRCPAVVAGLSPSFALRGRDAWPIAVPFLAAVGPLAARRAVGQPATARRPDAGAVGAGRAGSSARPPAARGGSSRPSSAPRTRACRPTTSRRTRSQLSPTARRPPTSDSTCSPPSPPATSAGSGTLDDRRPAEATLATMGRLERFRGHFYNWYDTTRPSPAGAPLRVDGRQRQPRGSSARSAATPVASGSIARCSVTSVRRDRGRRSCSSREATNALARRPAHARSRAAHLDQACEAARARCFATRPRTVADWVVRLGQLAGQADALVDIARTLTAERGEGEDSEVLVWAEATRATIASHRARPRTTDAVGSPSRRPSSPASTDAAARRRSRAAPSVPRVPPWPSWRTSARARSASSPPRSRGGRRGGSPPTTERVEHVHELIGQLEGAAAASRALVERLSAVAARHGPALRGDGLRLPLRLAPQALLDRLPRHGREPRSELLRPARLGGAARELRRDRQGRRRRRRTGSASAAR